MSKTKLLIVINSLAQAGSERWVYEICRHIDRNKFDVGVLCAYKYFQVEPEKNYENYYYHKLKESNIKLYEYLGGSEKQPIWRRAVNKILRSAGKILGKDYTNPNPKIVKLLESFDVICVINFYNYNRVKKELYNSGNRKFFIVLHSHLNQLKPEPYKCFDKNKTYNFLHYCPKQIDEIGESGLDIAKNHFFYFPLVINLSDYPYLFNPIKNDPIIISIFTRISTSKPIDFFIDAFEQLQKQMNRPCLLNIYGAVEDENYYNRLRETIESSSIKTNTARFMGHTKSIASTISGDKINLYWGVTIDASVGYSSIELGAMGVPGILWNENSKATAGDVEEQTDGALLAATEVDDFVAYNLKYLQGNKLLNDLSVRQRDYLIGKYNIVDKINEFEDYVNSINI